MAGTRSGGGNKLLVAGLATALLASLGVLGVLVALMLPAVRSSRDAAKRAQCLNNVRNIGLALAQYESAYGGLPPSAITDEEGRALLSWRVLILPYLGEEPLFERFHLDEPWDSPHNQRLLDEMPMVLACPNGPGIGSGETSYRVFEGSGTAFEAPGGHRTNDFSDGRSNTILVVEAEEATPWTKPSALPFNAESELPPMSSNHPRGDYAVAFADGSIRFLRLARNSMTLRAMLTRDGGEILSASEF